MSKESDDFMKDVMRGDVAPDQPAAGLTSEQVEHERESYKNGYGVDDKKFYALCDAALDAMKLRNELAKSLQLKQELDLQRHDKEAAEQKLAECEKWRGVMTNVADKAQERLEHVGAEVLERAAQHFDGLPDTMIYRSEVAAAIRYIASQPGVEDDHAH